MRKEETQFKAITWVGDMGPGVGDRQPDTRYRIEPSRSSLMMAFHGSNIHAIVYGYSLPHLLNFYRDLGEAIDFIQPGVINPLPDGEPDYVDALKVIHEADRLRMEEK